MTAPSIPRRSLAGRKLLEDNNGALIWDGALIGPPRSLGPFANAPAFDNDRSRYFEVFDDFLYPATATASEVQAWVSMDDGATGTNAFQDVSGGIYNIVTAAAQDDYHGIRSFNKNFLFVANKQCWFEAKFKLAEGATNKSAWIFGLMSAVTTGGLQAGAAGPLSNFSGAVLFKNEGTMVGQFMTSNGATQNTNTNLGTVVTNTDTKVGFWFDGSATTGVITPYIDLGGGAGWQAGTAKNITLASLAQMYLVATAKAGAGGAAETMQLDYVHCVMER